MHQSTLHSVLDKDYSNTLGAPVAHLRSKGVLDEEMPLTQDINVGNQILKCVGSWDWPMGATNRQWRYKLGDGGDGCFWPIGGELGCVHPNERIRGLESGSFISSNEEKTRDSRPERTLGTTM
ncbi:hypothetical protein TcasGA2_TC006233 [Tribolium castaneum]|uniref:Uncharacterized protein n=1 Tax=Tribolium castaneum TaxID=7070 RepID=D6WVJ4_TRICA|nr:hypothetical protein TcasGA2_TC006233 [Tribolium castaneum]